MRGFLLTLAVLIGLASPSFAADSTVANMPAASALSGAELFYCVQGGADHNCTANQMKTFGAEAVGSTPYIGNAPGATTSSSDAQRASHVLNVIDDFGATGNLQSWQDGTISTSSNAFSSTLATFTAADIGKTIVVDNAGVGGAPLVTTITGFTDSHHVTLGANASVTTQFTFVNQTSVSTPQSGSGSYVPGDTITLAGGTFTTAAITTVKATTVVSATVVAGGSGGVIPTGGATGNCTVTGTTGSGGQKFTLSVALTAGVITAINGVVNGGEYMTNPTTITAEPVGNGLLPQSVGTCTGISGATVNLKMGVLLAVVSTKGVYSAVPGTFTQGATSGAGTGATFTAITYVAGNFYYGTDDTSAISAAINAEIAAWAAGTSYCVYLPTGKYLISSPLPTFYSSSGSVGTAGCIYGQGPRKTYIVPTPALSGDVISFSRNYNFGRGGGGTTLVMGAAEESPIVSDMTVVGDLGSANIQHALTFYDENETIEVSRFEALYMTGSCLRTGVLKNSTNAYVAESRFTNIRFFECGNTTGPNPAVDFYSQGAGQGNNEIRVVNLDIFAPLGNGLQIHASGVGSGGYDFVNTRVEGLQWIEPTVDEIVIGDTTSTTGGVSNIRFANVHLIDSYLGQAAFRMTSANTTVAPYLVDAVNMQFGGGIPYGRALEIDWGRYSSFDIRGMLSFDYNVVLGPSTQVSTPLEIRGIGGEEASWAWSLGSGSTLFPSAPTLRYGVPYNNGSFFVSGKYRDNTFWGGAPATTGGIVDIGSSAGQVYQAPTAQFAVQLGGTGNQNSASFGGVVAGNLNSASGTYTGIIGGTRITDRGWYGSRALASGALGDFQGDAQFQDQVLRCSLSSTSACRATADNATAGSANVVNIPNNAAYALNVTCAMFDRTTNTKNASWNNMTYLLTRGSSVGTTALAGTASPSATQSNGTLTGMALSLTADTTNGGLNVSFTPPTSNTDTMDFSCHVEAQQTQ